MLYTYSSQSVPGHRKDVSMLVGAFPLFVICSGGFWLSERRVTDPQTSTSPGAATERRVGPLHFRSRPLAPDAAAGTAVAVAAELEPGQHECSEPRAGGELEPRAGVLPGPRSHNSQVPSPGPGSLRTQRHPGTEKRTLPASGRTHRATFSSGVYSVRSG